MEELVRCEITWRKWEFIQRPGTEIWRILRDVNAITRNWTKRCIFFVHRPEPNARCEARFTVIHSETITAYVRGVWLNFYTASKRCWVASLSYVTALRNICENTRKKGIDSRRERQWSQVHVLYLDKVGQQSWQCYLFSV